MTVRLLRKIDPQCLSGSVLWYAVEGIIVLSRGGTEVTRMVAEKKKEATVEKKPEERKKVQLRKPELKKPEEKKRQ